MPLAWAHAEYVKLLRSVEEQRVWDTPPQTVERYQVQQKVSPFEVWTEHAPRLWVSKGKQLRMDLDAPGTVVWKADRGAEIRVETGSPRFNLHSALLELPGEWKLIRISIEQSGTTRKLRVTAR
jgi:glucoamylase